MEAVKAAARLGLQKERERGREGERIVKCGLAFLLSLFPTRPPSFTQWLAAVRNLSRVHFYAALFYAGPFYGKVCGGGRGGRLEKKEGSGERFYNFLLPSPSDHHAAAQQTL